MKRILSLFIAALLIITPVTATTVSAKTSDVEVDFTLIGDSIHDGYDTHDIYQLWIPTETRTCSPRDTVETVLRAALKDHELNASISTGYLSAITAPKKWGGHRLKAGANMQYSGWVFTVNGEHPMDGMADIVVSQGDDIVFHYVDDWMQEVEPTGSDYQRWLTYSTRPSGGSTSGTKVGGKILNFDSRRVKEELDGATAKSSAPSVSISSKNNEHFIIYKAGVAFPKDIKDSLKHNTITITSGDISIKGSLKDDIIKATNSYVGSTSWTAGLSKWFSGSINVYTIGSWSNPVSVTIGKSALPSSPETYLYNSKTNTYSKIEHTFDPDGNLVVKDFDGGYLIVSSGELIKKAA